MSKDKVDKSVDAKSKAENTESTEETVIQAVV